MKKLVDIWSDAARTLGLDILTSGVLTLDSGKEIYYDVLLKQFGYENGMIIVNDFNRIERETDAILDAGYGFSTLDEPTSDEDYTLEGIIDLLSDWTWNGPPDKRPEWLLGAPDDNDDDKMESSPLIA